MEILTNAPVNALHYPTPETAATTENQTTASPLFPETDTVSLSVEARNAASSQDGFGSKPPSDPGGRP